MNRFAGVLIGLGLCVSGTSVPAGDYVIAVIDPTRIMQQSPQYEAASAQLEKEVSERKEKLAEQQKQIAELEQKLKRDAALMSEDEVQRLTTDISKRKRKLKYAEAEFREDMSLRNNELNTKLTKQVEEVVTELAREESIDLIVSDNLVFHASERIDISDKVIGRLREKFEAR
ncbi:MAG: OmpH family outer membrane protein [Chromatiaceae bacterium]|nr:OmpH family outer membrane protein [Chromatiaceae bacterium]